MTAWFDTEAGIAGCELIDRLRAAVPESRTGRCGDA